MTAVVVHEPGGSWLQLDNGVRVPLEPGWIVQYGRSTAFLAASDWTLIDCSECQMALVNAEGQHVILNRERLLIIPVDKDEATGSLRITWPTSS